MYFGRVAEGEGYQVLLPAGSNTSSLLKIVNVRVL